MRLPRFRLRTMMIGVAVVALIAGGEMMRRRRAECLRRAEACAAQERLLLDMATWCEEIAAKNEGRGRESRELAGETWAPRGRNAPGRMSVPGVSQLESDRRAFWEDHWDFAVDSAFAPEWAVTPDSAARARGLADRYASERRRYERVAARPWLPVGPDPLGSDGPSANSAPIGGAIRPLR
jgi:hypothetical protein